MKLYFEDLEEGTVFRGDECVADRDEMLEYARKNDPSPFHVDEEAARNSPYGGLIASAGYTVTLWYRSGIPISGSIAFLGGFEWHIKLPLPVRPGDRLRTEVNCWQEAGKQAGSGVRYDLAKNSQSGFAGGLHMRGCVDGRH